MKNKKIMIVEDEAIVALQIKSDLELMGHTVTGTYASGEEALVGVSTALPELILMDIQLQGEIDGIEAAVLIAKDFDLPVIFLTAHSEEAVVEKATATRPYGYLLKPVSLQDLQIAIQVALHRHKIDNEKAQIAQELLDLTLELKRSEKNLRDITSNLGVGVYVFNREGRITFMNSMAEELWGWPMEAVNEHGAHALVHHRRADGISLPLEECRMHGVINSKIPYVSSDEVFVRRDGTVFPVSVITTPIMKDGEVSCSVTAFRDITKEIILEEELHRAQKLESVGVLAGGIAHDFNNLLTAIMGNIELAKMFLDGDKPELSAPLLDKALTACLAAKELSFRLLTFSKGGDPVRRVSSIEEVLTKSVVLALDGSTISTHLALEPGLSPVAIDQGQMRQVICNILINAKEAMPEGGTVTLSAHNVILSAGDHIPLPEGEYVRISIQDNGCGISKENLSWVFDPYFTTRRRGSQKGTGLGLSICRSIVRKHDGHISVESQQGQGTTVRIYLPSSSPEIGVPATGALKARPAVNLLGNG